VVQQHGALLAGLQGIGHTLLVELFVDVDVLDAAIRGGLRIEL
jgi:hypothetical protein